MGVTEVKKEMAVETHDIDAVKSQLGEVLDEFIADIRYAPIFIYLEICVEV